jgi:hypothetical protein
MAVTRKPRPQGVETLPRREELEALARHYHHLQVEHQNAAPGSAIRRRLEDRLLEVRERFERLLAEWVPDEELREAWNAYLDHHAPEPPGPPAIRPLVFRGVSPESGSVLEIRGKGDDLEAAVDGAVVERIAAEKDFAARTPFFRFRLNGSEFEETFSASPEALRALAAFLDEEGSSPPWEYASELLADGLVDLHFALTPRGRRALARLDAQ